MVLLNIRIFLVSKSCPLDGLDAALLDAPWVVIGNGHDPCEKSDEHHTFSHWQLFRYSKKMGQLLNLEYIGGELLRLTRNGLSIFLHLRVIFCRLISKKALSIQVAYGSKTGTG